MHCPHCQHENRETARFCGGCGGSLVREVPCGACGVSNPGGQKFCDACGQSLGTEAAPERDPRIYTPPHLADKILQSKSALEGERKQVTVLFADVKVSMELAGQLDPEDWHAILDRFFAILTDGVHRFEGTVNQYTGDGIMALFGAPIAHEDHAQRACHAALRLLDELRRYAQELRLSRGLDFSARLGINTGVVVVGKIGDDLRMDYTAQGHTVGLAARMEQIAEPGSAYLTEYTAAKVRGYFDLADLGPSRVKGVAEPLRVFSLSGLGAMRSRFDVSRARGLSKFVGREAEMNVLERAYARACEGQDGIVGIVAEAGTGKSRLLHEFMQRCRERGAITSVSACVSHGKDIPLLPYMEGLRQYYGITDGDSVQTCQDKITGRMIRLDAGLADEVPFMLDFLGVPDPGRPVQDMAPEARTRRLLELLRAQRAVRGRESVFVYVVEDLHWSDPATHAITEGYCKSLGATSTLVVLTFRPEYRADWAPSHVYEQIALRPLDAASIRVLLETILGPAAVEQGLAERIHARTGGNPFFIEEVVESLVEAGALEGTRGAYRLTRPVDELVVPDTVQAVLAARIDRLDGGAKSVLQTASVIDKTVPLAILRRIAGVPDRELDGALQVLADAAFVYEEAVRPDVVYGFKHPLTQEVAYGSLLKDRRQQLHGELARVLEGHHADRLDENAALIAHHYESAGEALAAARWHRRAAEWVGRTDLAAATRHWRSVRALRREVPDDVEAAALGIAACRQLLQNMTFRVAVDLDARAVFEEGLALANAVDNHREALYLSMSYSRVLGGDGDVAQNLDLAVKNHRAALEMDDVAVRANAATYLVDVLNVSGQLAQVLEVADTEIARVPRRLPREEWLWGFNHQTLLRILRAFAVTWTGGLREALEEFVHVLRLAEEDGTPEMAGYAFFYTAEAQYQAGDAAGVLASARRIEAISHARPEHLGLFAHTQQAFGLAHLAAGRAAEAAESFRTALDHHQRVDKAYAGKAACYLAEAWLQAGDLSAAQGGAEEAIALCRRSLRAVYEAIAHGVMARALLRRDGAAARDAAEAALASAAALIERTGAKTLAPALCEWRAELSAVLGDGTTREQRLRQALQGYADIGAPAHAARLAREPFASSPLR